MLASWVGQLGMRQVPQSIYALVAGRTRILFVKVHDVREPAPEEDWLRANAEVLSEIRLGSASCRRLPAEKLGTVLISHAGTG